MTSTLSPHLNGQKTPIGDVVKLQARGLWPSILVDVAGIPRDALDGRHHPCPKCGGRDRFRAFDDVAETGGCFCNQCFSEKNGDGLSTIQWMLNVDFRTAVRRVQDFLRMPTTAPKAGGKSSAGGRTFPTPEAAARSAANALGGTVAKLWPYHDAGGNVVAYACRVDTPTPEGEKQNKEFRPVTRSGTQWTLRGMDEPRPLYDLPGILTADKSSKIFVVEGEKAGDAGRSIGLTCTTSFGGAKGPHKTDWEPLAGRTVVIVPDNDEAGEGYAAKVADLLAKLTPRPVVRVLRLPKLPLKGDLADFIDLREAAEPDELRFEIERLAESAPLAAMPSNDASDGAEPRRERDILAPGAIVRPKDRDNFGTVVSDDGAEIIVRFQSPDGNTAEKSFPPSMLRKQDGSPVEPLGPALVTPKFRSVIELANEFPRLREPVIEGLLRAGETMNIVAASKVGKSWLVYLIGLCVATGRSIFGEYDTNCGPVLLIDNELHEETSAHRIPAVAEAMGLVPEDYADSLFVENLRGRLVDIHAMEGYFERIERNRFRLIVLDAQYRFLPQGESENDNAAMTVFFNRVDQYAAMTGSAFVMIHHASKGDQSGKAITDVGAGAGSQSRAADSHLILRPHESEDCCTLEAVTRSWKQPKPVVLRWSFPLWSMDREMDPAAIKRPRGFNDDRQEQKDRDGIREIADVLREGPASKTAIHESTGFGHPRIGRLLAIMKRDGSIEIDDEKGSKMFRLTG